jgi:hypothetical protein
MSSVFFNGNTYTFGATVAANPGTGTTSHVFGGLSSGSTFGFILRAFNDFGFSNFVGPSIIKTLSETPEEIRPLISALEWNSPYEPIATTTVYVDPYDLENQNLFMSSENLIPFTIGGPPIQYGWEPAPPTITPPMSITSGFSAPDGSTTAWQFTSSSATGWGLLKRMSLDTGKTYYLSYYYDLSRGNTGTFIGLGGMYWEGGILPSIRFQPFRQILPVVGSMVTGGSNITQIGSATGWTRFAWEFNTISGYSDGSRLVMGIMSVVRGADFGLGTAARYFWGPQLELAE